MNQPPVADADGPYQGSPGHEITFTGEKSYDPDGNIVSWQWEFGDGSKGSGEVVTHAYTKSGEYQVKLTVIDNRGATGSDGTSARVNEPPVADADGPYQGKTKEPVTLTGAKSFDPDGKIVSWQWEFGDGSKGSGEVVTHTYKEPGKYKVKLTVTDNDGASSTDTTDVSIVKD
jgi:PKD repeat protein